MGGVDPGERHPTLACRSRAIDANKGNNMQYLLMIYEAEAQWGTMSEAEAGKLMGEYGEFTKGIVASKHYVGGNRLQPVTTATTVRVKDGKTTKTHGPFAETREQLGGYYLIEAKDLDEACAIAARIPGARYGSVEVRPIHSM
jgi:hypothetical protein